LGLSVAVFAAVQLGIGAVAYFDPDVGTLGYGDMLMSSTAAVAFVLSYPLIRGCNWARIVLVAVLSCCAVGVILLIPFSFIANHWIYTRVAISLSGLSTLCVIFFTILLLFHADVVVILVASHDATGNLLTNRCSRQLPGQPKNFFRAAPGKGEAGAAVTVIMNNRPAILQAIAFQANA
jgi:hypothetical protein